MTKGRQRQSLHVIGDDIVASIERGARSRCGGKHCGAAGTRAVRHLSGFARRAYDANDIVDDGVRKFDLGYRADGRRQRLAIEDLFDAQRIWIGHANRWPRRRDDGALIGFTWVREHVLKEKPVELRLGQWIGALL